MVVTKLCGCYDCILSVLMLLRHSVTSEVWFRTLSSSTLSVHFRYLCAWEQKKDLENPLLIFYMHENEI